MPGISKNPNVTNGTLNAAYIKEFPKTTNESDSPDLWQKYIIGETNVASQIVRGTMTFNKEKLKELDPSYTGYNHIFVLNMPEFMKALCNNQYKGNDTNMARKAKYHYNNLKALIEMGSTSYSGTPNLTLNTEKVNVGWDEKSFEVPTTAAYDSTQFSIKCIETYGEPLRRAVEFYISGLADPNAKYQHLHNATVNGEPMQPSLSNITFTIMIIQTDQTLHNIQNIDVWSNCIITDIDRSHLDWELGTISIVQPQTLNFKGIYLPFSDTKDIYPKAISLLSKRLHYYKRLEDMTTTEMGVDQWADPNERMQF